MHATSGGHATTATPTTGTQVLAAGTPLIYDLTELNKSVESAVTSPTDFWTTVAGKRLYQSIWDKEACKIEVVRRRQIMGLVGNESWWRTDTLSMLRNEMATYDSTQQATPTVHDTSQCQSRVSDDNDGDTDPESDQDMCIGQSLQGTLQCANDDTPSCVWIFAHLGFCVCFTC